MTSFNATASFVDFPITLRDAIPPVADFGADLISGAAPLTVTFTNTSSGDFEFADWDFTNRGSFFGNTGTTEPVEHTYANPGIYSVRMRAHGFGNENEVTKESFITVSEPGSEGGGEGSTEGMSEGSAEGTGEGVSEGNGEGVTEGTSEGSTEGGSEGASEGDAEGGSEGTSEGITEGGSEGTSEGITEGGSEGTSEGSTEGGSEGASEGSNEGEGEGNGDTPRGCSANSDGAFVSPLDSARGNGGTLVVLVLTGFVLLRRGKGGDEKQLRF